jgi:hypothetical protein
VILTNFNFEPVAAVQVADRLQAPEDSSRSLVFLVKEESTVHLTDCANGGLPSYSEGSAALTAGLAETEASHDEELV